MGLAHRLAAATATALLLTGGLAGCSLPGTGSSSNSPSSPSGGKKAEGSVGKASFDNASKPLVKGTFDSPLAQGAKIDIAVMGLKTRGRLATLTMQLTPHVPPGGPTRINAYGLNGEHGLGTSLIDPVNLKRYVVVKDTGGKELETDDIFTHMTNDQVTPFYFTFAAPPENVKTVDVQIGTWPTFRDIPVER
ncbi:hypothetical protein OG979_10230 [Actinomadura citrea]|jgi:hypothetical protein|uniref:hypothetical protein n=1 Tax=Actinomadura TaxID=1988 RepID=UPI002E294D2D|nr:hypothetical protein [Actinomadura citrea]